MGIKSQKSKDGAKSRIWNSLHDIELMLNSFEKYEIGTVLGKMTCKIFIMRRVTKLLTVRKNM